MVPRFAYKNFYAIIQFDIELPKSKSESHSSKKLSMRSPVIREDIAILDSKFF